MKDKLLNWIINMATNHRRIVYISSAILTVAMLTAAISLWKMDTRWTELLPESLPEVKESKKIDAKFLQPGNLIIAISGKDPVKLEQITDEVTEVLKKELIAPEGMSLDEIKRTQRSGRHIYGKFPEKWLSENMLMIGSTMP